MGNGAPEIKSDFRDAAAADTMRMLNGASGALPDMTRSGCVRVSSAVGLRLLLELGTTGISFICMLSAFLAALLRMLGVISLPASYLMLAVGLGLLLMMRKIKSWIEQLYLKSRPDSLIIRFRHLPRRMVGLENFSTSKQVKVLIEDVGACMMDAENMRLLIEGFAYRYIIHGCDVTLIEPVSGYAFGGAHILCRMGNTELDFVLCVAGQGPLDSLVSSFGAHGSAKNLSEALIKVLLNIDGSNFKRQ